MSLPLSEIALRLVTATLLASFVGLDRERRESSAGLRTHALVGMSSCLLMIASAFGFADILGTPNVTLDPSRIAAQIVTGIGFLGAGTIIANGSTVRGLTTAASVWSVAAIGLAVGGGMYRAAFIATAISLLLLTLLRPWERRLDQRWRKQTISAVYDPGVASLEGIMAALHSIDLHVSRLNVDKSMDGGSCQVQITLEERGETVLLNATQMVTSVHGVQSATAE
ncbi:MAG: MgtC/SapB family protein [Edaphobacter sp.]